METLRRTFRGYDPAQVDRLVSGLYSQLEARMRELEEVRQQNAQLSDELVELRAREESVRADAQAIQDALVSAHKQSDEILAQARKESELMLQVARETAHRYQEDLKGRIDDLTWQIERLTVQKQRFLAGFRELLENNLSLLTELGARPATPEEFSEDAVALASVDDSVVATENDSPDSEAVSSS